MLDGEVLPRPPEPALHLVRDEEDAVGVADLPQPGEVARRRDHEAALAQHRLGQDGGHLVGAYVVLEGLLDQVGALQPALAAVVARIDRAAIAVRVGQPVDLRRERAEVGLVGHDLGGQGHGEQGPSVEGVLEGDDGVLARGVPGDLDGVLDGFSPGVREHGLDRSVDGHGPVHLGGQGDVRFVRHDVEAGVRELGGLVLDGGDHAGVAVAHVHHADPPGKVDVLAPLDVDDGGVLGGGGEEVGDVRRSSRDLGQAVVPQRFVRHRFLLGGAWVCGARVPGRRFIPLRPGSARRARKGGGHGATVPEPVRPADCPDSTDFLRARMRSPTVLAGVREAAGDRR